MNFQNFRFEAAAGTSAQLPPSTLPEVVFSGRSNVGKSSLLNTLCGRKSLARVSATPGKTGTINFFLGDACRLVDLPGYGYAKVSKEEKRRWGELVEGYFAGERQIALVLQLVDMRRDPTQDDTDMLRFLSEQGLPFAAVLTKADKLNCGETAQQQARFAELFGKNGIPFIAFSAVKGTGTEELKLLISGAVQDIAQEEAL